MRTLLNHVEHKPNIDTPEELFAEIGIRLILLQELEFFINFVVELAWHTAKPGNQAASTPAATTRHTVCVPAESANLRSTSLRSTLPVGSFVDSFPEFVY